MDATYFLGIASGVIVTLVSGGIIWACKRFVDRLDDRIVLTADIRQSGDLEIVQYVGCSCMVVSVTCRSKRPAKLKGALIALEGVNLLPNFEKAFGANFGGVPVNVDPRPVYTVDLIPIGKDRDSKAFVLERDDTIEFALPIRLPGLPLFTEAPSQDVWVEVEHLDGKKEIVLRGLRIQKIIEDLIEMWGNAAQTLHLTVNIGLRSTTSVLPQVSHLIGATNPNPLVVMDRGEDQHKPIDGEVAGSAQIRLPLFGLVSPDEKKTVMLDGPQGRLLPILSTRSIAEDYVKKSPQPVKIVEFATKETLISFLQSPPSASGNTVTDFNIMFDSIHPTAHQQVLVTRDEMLAAFQQPQ
jgi:hypothetical protein